LKFISVKFQRLPGGSLLRVEKPHSDKGEDGSRFVIHLFQHKAGSQYA